VKQNIENKMPKAMFNIKLQLVKTMIMQMILMQKLLL